jgi:hypothetical protein
MGKSTRFAIDYSYANVPRVSNPSEQSKKFKDAAREAECDEDEGRWEERLKKVAGQKPKPEKEHPSG